jgi:hypothetical protein
VLAAALHDVVEDTDARVEDIEKMFILYCSTGWGGFRQKISTVQKD